MAVVFALEIRASSRFRAGFVGALWLVGAAWVVTADAFQEAPCTNFGRVGPGLYRGAEPSERCLDHLAKLGIRTVVNLRDEEEASELEKAKAVALGIRYVNMPMSGFGRPSVAEVERVLAIVCGPENQPVFLHCKRGRDRTGVIVAVHRMAHEGWPAERAMEEAKGFGLAWWQFRMKKFIRNFGANASLRKLESEKQEHSVSGVPSDDHMHLSRGGRLGYAVGLPLARRR